MTTARSDIAAIYAASVDAVRAESAIAANVAVEGHLSVRIAGESIPLGGHGVYVIAIGKAAVGMISAAARSLGDSFARGVAVTKSENPTGDRRITVLRGSHPVPDERSLEAGEAVLQFAQSVPDGAAVLCLISGGGSALVESLHAHADLSELRTLTRELLEAGASIHELNAVRSRLSRIKAGGLLRALSHARVHNLIVSDVLGNDVQTIASGPTVPAAATDAESVLQRYGLSLALPPLEELPPLAEPPTTIVADLSLAIDAAARAAAERGYAPFVLSRSVEGEAREVGRTIASVVADAASGRTSFPARTCLLAGGETTVTVRSNGVGGRNTEAALSAAIRLRGVGGVALGFLATDGDDGASPAAGGIVDGATVDGDTVHNALAALAANDSYTFLSLRDAVHITGSTGTNVNDLIIGIIE